MTPRPLVPSKDGAERRGVADPPTAQGPCQPQPALPVAVHGARPPARPSASEWLWPIFPPRGGVWPLRHPLSLEKGPLHLGLAPAGPCDWRRGRRGQQARPGKGPLGCGRAGPGCGSPAQACSAMLGTLTRSGHLSRRASWGTRVGSPQGPAAFCPPESPGDSAPGEGGRARRPSCVDRPRGPTASRAGHTDPAAALGQR